MGKHLFPILTFYPPFFMFQKQENAVNKSSGLKASTEKLLSNRFAHQVQLTFLCLLFCKYVLGYISHVPIY